MARDRLTETQQLFLAELVNNGGDATAAYRLAFPKAAESPNASAMAARLKRHPLVQQGLAEAREVTLSVIQSVVDRYQITAERVRRRAGQAGVHSTGSARRRDARG